MPSIRLTGPDLIHLCETVLRKPKAQVASPEADPIQVMYRVQQDARRRGQVEVVQQLWQAAKLGELLPVPHRFQEITLRPDEVEALRALQFDDGA